ncbi:hypothetical protein CEQ90_06725 [Lewinellaceae bacterium SD302]|nr:hypothetical protein CEQ90_06725 [Lewinellaceae bacterium SD302]
MNKFFTPSINFRIIKLLLLCLGMAVYLPAQITPSQQAQARQELKRRNIDETELKARLLERGIDVDNMNPAELAAAQSQIEAVVAEMEAEARVRPAETSAPVTTPEPAEPPPAVVEAPPLSTPPSNLEESTIWGHQVFRNKSLQVYQPNDNVSAPPSYRLGTGDVIAVNIFGASQADLKLTIDEDGFINPPAMPRIQLRGLRLDRARELAQTRFARYYVFNNGQFSFNVDATRIITVNIYGETETNGSFTLSAVNTVFNALVAAGGPKDEGSVRNIKLISGGEETVVDIYEFLLNPTQQPNLFLEDNDVIFVPLASKIVEVQGGVRRPLNYELRDGEDLKTVLAYAGGLLPESLNEGITVTRSSGNKTSVLNVETTTDFALDDGDIVLVPVSTAPQRQQVSINGAVIIPGTYAFTPGMRVADLLQKGKLQPGSRLDAGFLRRLNADSTATLIPIDYQAALNNAPKENIELQSEDQLIVFSQSTYTPRYSITVTGAVNTPLPLYPYSDDGSLTVRDALILAGGLKPNASEEAFLIRRNPANELERQYVRLNLGQSSGMDQLLRPLDSLVVYTNERFSERFPLQVTGAVRAPGQYVYDVSLGLKDLFTLAGGLKLGAARNRIDVVRLQFGENETTKTISIPLEIDEEYNVIGGPTGGFLLRPYDVVVVRSVPEFELVQTVDIQGEVRFPGIYAMDSDNLKLTDLLTKSGGLTAEAFPAGAVLERKEENAGAVVIRLDDAIKSPGSVANLKLRNGDIVFIPKVKDLVAIRPLGTRAEMIYVDSLLNDGSLDVAFDGDHSAKWYVNNFAGGFSDDALRRSLTVQYPNGELGRTKKFLWINNYPEIRPGSTIRMELKPEKIQRERREERFDWIAMTSAILGGAGTILTAILLATRN